jgi:hypothetical protein
VLGREIVGAAMQPAREIDADRLVGHPGRGVQVDEHVPLVGGQPGLLGQLALRRVEGGLAVDVEQPGRQLVEAGADGGPVLVDEHDVGVVVQGHDADRAGMGDDLALGDLAVAHPHVVDPHGNDLALELGGGPDDVVAVLLPHQPAARIGCSATTTPSDGPADPLRSSGISTGRRSAAL